MGCCNSSDSTGNNSAASNSGPKVTHQSQPSQPEDEAPTSPAVPKKPSSPRGFTRRKESQPVPRKATDIEPAGSDDSDSWHTTGNKRGGDGTQSHHNHASHIGYSSQQTGGHVPPPPSSDPPRTRPIDHKRTKTINDSSEEEYDVVDLGEVAPSAASKKVSRQVQKRSGRPPSADRSVHPSMRHSIAHTTRTDRSAMQAAVKDPYHSSGRRTVGDRPGPRGGGGPVVDRTAHRASYAAGTGRVWPDDEERGGIQAPPKRRAPKKKSEPKDPYWADTSSSSEDSFTKKVQATKRASVVYTGAIKDDSDEEAGGGAGGIGLAVRKTQAFNAEQDRKRREKKFRKKRKNERRRSAWEQSSSDDDDDTEEVRAPTTRSTVAGAPSEVRAPKGFKGKKRLTIEWDRSKPLPGAPGPRRESMLTKDDLYQMGY